MCRQAVAAAPTRPDTERGDIRKVDHKGEGPTPALVNPHKLTMPLLILRGRLPEHGSSPKGIR